MAEHNTHGPVGPSEEDLKASIAAGYEKEDVSLSVLLRWGGGLAIFLLATSVFALFLFAALQRPPFGPPPLGTTSIRTQPTIPPNGMPIVQDNPVGDPRPDNNPRKGIDNIREFRREEEIHMSEYAVQDGNIHVPLDRAMELELKDFEAQKPGEAPSGVSPTPEMKIHPDTGATGAPGGAGAVPAGTTSPSAGTISGGASPGGSPSTPGTAAQSSAATGSPAPGSGPGGSASTPAGGR